MTSILARSGYDGTNPNNNPVCNKKIKATCKPSTTSSVQPHVNLIFLFQDGGNSVEVIVTDRCEACKETDLDFSPSAFTQLADQSIGRITGMTWEWVE